MPEGKNHKKDLSGKTLEELWNLFPIILRDHDPAYIEWYSQEKEEIYKYIDDSNIARINHIGSSLVRGLVSKPTVDILLELHKESDPEKIKSTLINSGWILMHFEKKPVLKMVFNKGYTPDGFAEKIFHLHVRHHGDWDELYFRDYLISHEDIAEEYGKFKLGLLKKYRHNRDGYTEAKTEFIKKYTKKARKEFEGKYLPK
jgi:GrpB-like predicted nucleotidyltransferase (UPF0157 family)